MKARCGLRQRHASKRTLACTPMTWPPLSRSVRRRPSTHAPHACTHHQRRHQATITRPQEASVGGGEGSTQEGNAGRLRLGQCLPVLRPNAASAVKP
jgi:hypothetical protein